MELTGTANASPATSAATPSKEAPTDSTIGLVAILAMTAMFVVTLDAVIVNVALPAIQRDVGGGVSGMQWVADAYTLMFAASLLAAGAACDRYGAKRAFAVGFSVFLAASAACGAAPTLATLLGARVLQGAAAALVVPSSVALIGHAYPDRARRARAIGLWAVGGALASSSGPVLGGLLTTTSWRLIFLVNIPVGALGMALLARVPRSPRRDTPVQWAGFVLATLSIGSMTFAVIEAGAAGVTSGRVVAAALVALTAGAIFVRSQQTSRHPLVPPALIRRPNVIAASAVGAAFVVGYYGLPFVVSIVLQQHRVTSALATGMTFLPMMIVGGVLSPFSAAMADRLGTRRLVRIGLVTMAVGLAAVGVALPTAPRWLIACLMTVVGISGPAIMPPTMALLLNSVPEHDAGTASGIFNTARQVGGAMAVAVLGSLLAPSDGITRGARIGLLLAALVPLVTAAAVWRKDRPRTP